MKLKCLLSLALTTATLAQSPAIPDPDPDGRATPAQRAAAGVGAPVPELPPAAALTPAQQTARLVAWRAFIRRQLYVPDTLPALEPHTWSTFSPSPGVLADRVTYATAEGMLVPAIVYRPDPAVAHWTGKLPGIVIVNGHGGDKFSLLQRRPRKDAPLGRPLRRHGPGRRKRRRIPVHPNRKHHRLHDQQGTPERRPHQRQPSQTHRRRLRNLRPAWVLGEWFGDLA